MKQKSVYKIGDRFIHTGLNKLYEIIRITDETVHYVRIVNNQLSVDIHDFSYSKKALFERIRGPVNVT